MWRCSGCGEEHEDDFDTCWNCGLTIYGSVNEDFTIDGSVNEDFHKGDDVGNYSFDDSIMKNLILTTTSDIRTHEIKKYVGLVFSESILGINIINDFFSGITDLVGGRSNTYESYIYRARKIALEEVARQTIELGANGIIGIHFDYETIRGTMLMVTCSGTAVIAEEK